MNTMKFVQILFIAILGVFLMIACDQKAKNPVAEYGDAMVSSYEKGQQAAEIANLDAVKKAIEIYRITNDRYPRSLDDIKDLISSNIDMSKYDYNPENGTVSLKK